jgi:hypothetical protein
MNPKVILGLLVGASVGVVLPIESPSATAAALSDRSESSRQSSIQIDLVDFEARNSFEQLIAGNSSSNSSSDSDSDSNSNSSSNSSSNTSSNSSSDSNSDSDIDDD